MISYRTRVVVEATIVMFKIDVQMYDATCLT